MRADDDCKKIGALIVIDGEKLVGIFTERDALNKVLAAGLEPGKTKVSEVMTRDPYSIPPTTTVGEAMEIVPNDGSGALAIGNTARF